MSAGSTESGTVDASNADSTGASAGASAGDSADRPAARRRRGPDRRRAVSDGKPVPSSLLEIGLGPAVEIEPLPDRRVTKDRRRQRRRRRTAVWVFTALTVLALVALGALVVRGVDAAKRVKGGTAAEIISDPAAPGYLAGLDPTPVHLLAVTDSEDQLSAFMAIVPSTRGGASVIWTLAELIVDRDGESQALSAIYANEGVDVAAEALELELGFGVSDVTVVGRDEWATLATPVAPLTVSNPDTVSVATGSRTSERFESGEVELSAEEVVEFLTVRGVGEAPENRSVRAEALVSSLSSGLAEEFVTSAEGEALEVSVGEQSLITESGVDLVTVLASAGAGEVDFIVMATSAQEFRGSFLYYADRAAVAEQLAGVVPLPSSAVPGQRPRVRILNGSTDVTAAKGVAPQLAEFGAEVLLVGNAESFDVATTTVTYSDEGFAGVAASIAEFFEIEATRADEMSDAADIDVIIGSDFQK